MSMVPHQAKTEAKTRVIKMLGAARRRGWRWELVTACIWGEMMLTTLLAGR